MELSTLMHDAPGSLGRRLTLGYRAAALTSAKRIPCGAFRAIADEPLIHRESLAACSLTAINRTTGASRPLLSQSAGPTVSS